jgi:hypothetical protein
MPPANVKDPEIPTSLLPGEIMISPDLPFVADPVPIEIKPVFPTLLEPVLKNNEPLTPNLPAFKLRITTLPLVVAVPSPDEMRTTPPV